MTADLDGDGRDEIIQADVLANPNTLLHKWNIWNASTFSSQAPSKTERQWSLSFSRPIDRDRDGKYEILSLGFEQGNPRYQLFRFLNGSLVAEPWFATGVSANISPTLVDLGDADGDGHLDLFVARPLVAPYSPDSVHISTSTESGLVWPAPSPPAVDTQVYSWHTPIQTQHQILDLRGTGRAGWMVKANQPTTCANGQAFVSMSATGVRVVDHDRANLDNSDYTVMAEINGDGLKDALMVAGPRVRWNTGDGFDAPVAFPVIHNANLNSAQIGNDRVIWAVDVDGDGREDLIKWDAKVANDKFSVFLSRGDHFFSYPINTAYFSEQMYRPTVGDINGDGRVDIVGTRNMGTNPHLIAPVVMMNDSTGVDRITKVSDEPGPSLATPYHETIDYSGFWGPGQYEGTSCTHPQVCAHRGVEVVRSHNIYNGMSYNTHDYEYADARFDLLGRGFLGFARVDHFDRRRESQTTTTFDLTRSLNATYPFAGRPSVVTEVVNNSVPAFSRTTTYTHQMVLLNAQKTWTTYTRAVDVDIRESRNGSTKVIRRQHLWNDMDSFGNIVATSDRTEGGIHESARFSFEVRLPDWLISLNTAAELRSKQDGASDPPAQVVEREYDAAGRLTKETSERGDANLERSSEFHYTWFGAPDWVKDIAGSGARTTWIHYDQEGVHPALIINPLGHMLWLRMHPGLDVPVAVASPNQIVERMYYDRFGRIRRRTKDGGEQTDYTYTSSASTDYGVTSIVQGGVTTREELDALMRASRSGQLAFNGQWAWTETRYDLLGRVASVSRPDFGAPSALKTNYLYDNLDRSWQTVFADATAIITNYDGNVETHYDQLAHDRVITRDPSGRMVESKETVGALGTRTSSYTYGDWNTLRRVDHSFQSPMLFGYDRLGRRTSISDSDGGARTTTYDAFGQVSGEQDANNEHVRLTRDALGRVLVREDNRGKTRFVWDVGVFGVGKLFGALSPDGVLTTRNYDHGGRLSCETTSVEGQDVSTAALFDSNGRLEVESIGEFTLARRYNQYGYVDRIGEGSGGANTVLTVQDRTADGQAKRVTYGNGVSVDSIFFAATGRLLSRTSVVDWITYTEDNAGKVRTRLSADRRDRFEYDVSSRLTKWTHDFNGSQTIERTYRYDLSGNLLETRKNGQAEALDSFGNGNHRLARRDDASVAGKNFRYTYDADGRQLSAAEYFNDTLVQTDRTVTYSSFDLPVILNGTTFKYDAFGRRVKKEDQSGATLSVGPYELRPTGQRALYVSGDDGVAAEIIQTPGGSSYSTNIRYFQNDRVGSPTAVMDENGAVLERLYFEPFGARTDHEGKDLAGSPQTKLGLTGHRYDNAQLVNMNGRVYDAAIRKFMTPDPILGDSSYAESYNRDSYVWNSPIDLTDPTGFDPERRSYLTELSLDDIGKGLSKVGRFVGGGVGALVSAVGAGVSKLIEKSDGASAQQVEMRPTGPHLGVQTPEPSKPHLQPAPTLGERTESYVLSGKAEKDVAKVFIGAEVIAAASVGAVALVAASMLGNVAEQLMDNGGHVGKVDATQVVVTGAVAGVTYGLAKFIPSAIRAAMQRSGTAAEGVVGGGSGPWVPSAVRPGGAVAQTLPGSCGAACVEMLSGGAKSQAAAVGEIGEWASAGQVADALGPGWRSGYFGSGADALTVAGRGPMGGVLWAPGARAGHMVVIEPGPGGFLVRDPMPGVNYSVGPGWVQRWVAGGVWK